MRVMIVQVVMRIVMKIIVHVGGRSIIRPIARVIGAVESIAAGRVVVVIVMTSVIRGRSISFIDEEDDKADDCCYY